MWVLLNDSFLSIVAHRSKHNVLLVRARRADDIRAVFPKAKVRHDVGTDYEVRAEVKQREVERAMVAEVRRIDYDNFKNSVVEQDRHDIYLAVWSTLMRLGKGPRRRTVVTPSETEAGRWPNIDWAKGA